MRPVLSRAQTEAFEREVIAAGCDDLLLMENAGRGAAHLIGLRLKPKTSLGRATATRGSCVRCADEGALASARVVILAGAGNNGGDGYVVARHLRARAASVEVLRLGAPRTESAKTMARAFEAIGGVIRDYNRALATEMFGSAELLVDALFGIGLTRPLAGDALELVELANASGRPIIALDVPSGLDADTGEVVAAAIRAEHTVTFGFLKAGLLTTSGHEYGGRVTLSHLGIPARWSGDAHPFARLCEEEDVRGLLRSRPKTAHKGSSGKVLIVGGHVGMEGAARLAARAAFRGGAGLVTVGVSGDAFTRLREAPLDELSLNLSALSQEELQQRFRAGEVLVVGPGLGRSEEARGWLDEATVAGRPLVIDADGLRLLALNPRKLGATTVLTPHPGEAAALLASSIADVERDRFGAAKALAERYDAVVVLKGSRPIVVEPEGAPTVVAMGSASLAVAGSGDVLAGLLGAELSHLDGRTTFEAALAAVALHALAGSRFEEKFGPAGLMASELSDLILEVRAEHLAD